MATAKKLPSGSWRCLVYDYTDENKKRCYKSFTSDDPSPKGKRDAEWQAANFAMNKKENGICSKITFGKALDNYIENRSSVLSPATIREYKRSRKADLTDLMDIQLCDITQDMIQRMINAESKNHSPKSVRNMHGLLSAVLKAYRPDFALNTELPQKTRPKICIPTEVQLKAIMDVSVGTPMEIPILLAAFGPMRRSEICALDVAHIHENIVHVEKAMVQDEKKNWVIKQPKSYAGNREIPFPKFIIDKITVTEGYVTELNPTMITKRFEHILIKAGVPHFRFHDLRHYGASIQHAIGIPDAYIMQRGGWGSDAVLKSVYRHTMNDKNDEMTLLINNHFEALCNTKCNTKK